MNRIRILGSLSSVTLIALMSGCPGDKCSYWKDPACYDYHNSVLEVYEGGYCDGSRDTVYDDTYVRNVQVKKSVPYQDRYCSYGLACVDNTCRRICQDDSDCSDNSKCDSDGLCMIEGTVICGNGIVESGETCDDGNIKANDGCSKKCKVEAGWECKSDNSGKSVCSVKECHSEAECNGDSDSDDIEDSSSDALTDVISDDSNSDSNSDLQSGDDKNDDVPEVPGVAVPDDKEEVNPENPGADGQSDDSNSDDGNSDESVSREPDDGDDII